MSFQNKIQSGELVVGTCVTSNNPLWPKTLASSGLDFVFIDTEHISLSRKDLAEMCQTYAGRGIIPIVRVYKADHHLICQAIDAGAVGVVIPYVESVSEVQDLIGATKYRPLKGEKLNQYLEGKEKVPVALKNYLDKYNTGQLSIVNIESVPAIDKLEELLSIPGLDGVFIGPHDLSVSMGIPEAYDHPEFVNSVREIIKTSRKFGLAVGIHFSEAIERQIFWIKEGVNMVVHSSDFALFTQRLNSDLDQVRQISGSDIIDNSKPGNCPTI
ncbi:HpcH/HpaI aldolase family protein [Cyclobacterium qasimii]|uniref:2,4-dihydroxyhept-2-ene-1,7-dioic acid aldolase n=2 Tax=Cyclobacterium qasimii TaxID=1350429 RepID=S7WP13_9BACT|nr:aldolase/citrate lyase family protein [Cyclobacterium qasimii]EPR65893.1 2,4-dihydroxyhept-2-ene-1,7-dioic acid aldolase [Cyclobacterium qasimii M12-11B]GEO23197.1 2,4-dihydroxyhept-2-ene-1,7-dioic acid aldolase [Cyclobacterium qasimii]